jgi:ketosteroid isomerase-like protein
MLERTGGRRWSTRGNRREPIVCETEQMSTGGQVREVIGAINRGDVDGFLARTHADFEWEVLEASPLAGTYRGREQVRGYVEEWLNTFDDVRLRIERLVELEDQVLVIIRGSARGKASGVEVKNHFCQLWTMSEGVPARMHEYATSEEALAAASQR